MTLSARHQMMLNHSTWRRTHSISFVTMGWMPDALVAEAGCDACSEEQTHCGMMALSFQRRRMVWILAQSIK